MDVMPLRVSRYSAPVELRMHRQPAHQGPLACSEWAGTNRGAANPPGLAAVVPSLYPPCSSSNSPRRRRRTVSTHLHFELGRAGISTSGACLGCAADAQATDGGRGAQGARRDGCQGGHAQQPCTTPPAARRSRLRRIARMDARRGQGPAPQQQRRGERDRAVRVVHVLLMRWSGGISAGVCLEQQQQQQQRRQQRRQQQGRQRQRARLRRWRAMQAPFR